MKISHIMLAALLLLQTFAAHAYERHAFIVGNSEYDGSNALVNPVNDAIDMAAVLRELGYKIHSGGAQQDLTRIQFEQQFQEFVRRLPPESIALVYYAGHGMASNDDNYLIPIGADLTFQDQLPDRATGLSSLVKHLARNNSDGLNIFLLDACRDNVLKTRGLAGGLKRLGQAPQGTFIGYAADEGQVAADGQGRRNGVYTGELIKALRTYPGDPIELVHKNVAQRVREITKRKQIPVFDHKFVGDYCFADCGAEPVEPTVAEKRPTLPEKLEKQPIVSENKFKPWMAVLGAIAVGALLSSGGGTPGDPDDNVFTIPTDPPIR